MQVLAQQLKLPKSAMALHSIISQLSLIVLFTAYLTAAMPCGGKNVYLQRLNTTMRISQEYLQPNKTLSDLIGPNCNEVNMDLYCGVIVLHQFAQQLNNSMVSINTCRAV